MGCCFSHPAGPNAPYPGGAPSGSARAINSPRLQAIATEESSSRSPQVTQSNRPLSHHPATSPSSPQQQHRVREQPPLSQHIDKPLRRHAWLCKDRTWTRAQLARERADFFDTRVTGRVEIWQTLHAALEIMWEADVTAQKAGVAVGESDPDEDTALATAQSILKAAEITLPTGDLANGVYDSFGHYYALPEWIVRDPVNVVDGQQNSDTNEPSKVEDDVTGGEDTTEEVDDGETSRRREEKGKSIVNVRDLIKVRARLSEDARDITVSVSPSESVRSIARKVLDESGLHPPRIIKLAYMGKILKDGESLESQGYRQGHIINALVFMR